MAMKICKDCGTEVSKSAKICPKCGKKLKNTGLRITLGLIMLVICIGLLTTTGNNNTTPTSTQQQERFTLISNNKITDSIGTTYIEGEIKNNTDKSYTYVQVTFNLYDENGSQLGTAVDNINNLEPNATWKYKAIGLVTEKVATYKLVEITGW